MDEVSPPRAAGLDSAAARGTAAAASPGPTARVAATGALAGREPFGPFPASEPAAPARDAPAGAGRPEGRTARKRRAIMETATELFLANGYQGTSMDDIAAGAAVSKQTVYKHFADKEQLFAAIVIGAAARADEFVGALPGALTGSPDVRAALLELARHYLATVMQPRQLQLRRLVLGEASRFPGLARAYYERAPGRVIAALAKLGRRSGRGELRLDDPVMAASHYAYLVLGVPLDRAMFAGAEHDFSTGDLDRLATAAVRVFLAAYGQPGPAGSGPAVAGL